jgi:hypothetical protein
MARSNLASRLQQQRDELNEILCERRESLVHWILR